MQNQIHDLIDYSYIAREMYLTLDTVERALRRGLDIDGYFKDTHGVTYRELAAGCAWLWVHVLRPNEGGILIPGRATENEGRWDTLERVLDVISASRAQLVHYQHELAVDGYETYSLSALKKYPVVVLSDGVRVVPVANDLIDRALRSFFYDVRDMLNDAEFGAFGDASGAAYQALIEETLRACCGTDSVFRAEEVVERRDGEKVCDFICVERGHLTLVEVKSARPLMKTEVTKEPEALRKYVLREGSIADAVEQIGVTARAVKEGRVGTPKRQRVVGLVVTPGERVGINASFVRQVVRERLSQTAAGGFEKYLISDDLGFSVLCGSLGKRPGLGRLLWKLTTDKAHKFNDVHTQMNYGDVGKHPLEGKFWDHLGTLFADLDLAETT